MAMASWVHEQQPSDVVAIATFDHGTGAAAREAVELVRDWATDRGIAVHVGRAEGLPRRESAWRRARWVFLTSVAATYGVPVATAHTEDDQAETVFMRLLRQSGVRGLAGLLAAGPVRRPLLGVRREAVHTFVADRHVPYLDDPSNLDLRHLRNRVRHELLPAIERQSPGFRSWLLELGRAAANWRAGVSDATDRFWAPRLQSDGSILVSRERDRIPSEPEAALFWPEVAGRVGVALDRRGTARLATFTTKRVGGLQMPLSGGALVRSSREGWRLSPAASRSAGAAPKPPRTAGTTPRPLQP
jgi:tRNA(Ile)-lysidine synthase